MLLATEDARLFRYFAVDLTTGVRMARAVMRDMLSLRGGSIFFASIESGVQPQPWMMHYGAIKTCLLGVSRALAE